jgi:hypothetical protein
MCDNTTKRGARRSPTRSNGCDVLPISEYFRGLPVAISIQRIRSCLESLPALSLEALFIFERRIVDGRSMVSTLLSSLQTYSSLGAAVWFMTRLSISAIVLLPRAELDAETEHQIASHSTTGTPKPRSKRFNGIHVRAKMDVLSR